MKRFQNQRVLVIIILFILLFIVFMCFNDNEKRVPSQPIKEGHRKKRKEVFITDVHMPWKVWDSFTAPGYYRGCVKFPTESKTDGYSMQLEAKMTKDLTILGCLNQCISKNATYAGLSHGTQCYCINVFGQTSLLSYLENGFCNFMCSGETEFNCGGENYISLYRTSVSDTRCSKADFREQNSLPLIALASYPRSGNTWTRNLLQKASGIYTGNMNYNLSRPSLKNLITNVFKGDTTDYNLRKTIPIKTNSHNLNVIEELKDGVVLLIRNPYKAIVAEIHRRKQFTKHKNPIKEMTDFFNSAEWETFATEQIKRWQDMILTWVQRSKQILVVHYEDMLTDTSTNIRRMMEFMHLEIIEERLVCAIQEVPSSSETKVSLGNFGIRPRHYLTFDPYSGNMHSKIDASILKVNETLKEKGLKPLPTYVTTTLF